MTGMEHGAMSRLLRLWAARNSGRPRDTNDLAWWRDYVAEYFHPKAVVRLSVAALPIFSEQPFSVTEVRQGHRLSWVLAPRAEAASCCRPLVAAAMWHAGRGRELQEHAEEMPGAARCDVHLSMRFARPYPIPRACRSVCVYLNQSRSPRGFGLTFLGPLAQVPTPALPHLFKWKYDSGVVEESYFPLDWMESMVEGLAGRDGEGPTQLSGAKRRACGAAGAAGPGGLEGGCRMVVCKGREHTTFEGFVIVTYGTTKVVYDEYGRITLMDTEVGLASKATYLRFSTGMLCLWVG